MFSMESSQTINWLYGSSLSSVRPRLSHYRATTMSSQSAVSPRTVASNARIQARLVVLAGLLLASFAHAEKAIESTAGQSVASRFPHSPDWSAYIGTGRASVSGNLPKRDAGRPEAAAATLASADTPSPHWSARIGTGRVSSDNTSQRRTAASDVSREASSRASAPHWSSRIGTGSVVGS
jgi:hypothetical protein